MALGGLVLGTLIHYLRGTRIMMLQLSGFYYRIVQTAALLCRRGPYTTKRLFVASTAVANFLVHGEDRGRRYGVQGAV